MEPGKLATHPEVLGAASRAIQVPVTQPVTGIAWPGVPEAVPGGGVTDRKPDAGGVAAALQDLRALRPDGEGGLAALGPEITPRLRIAVRRVTARRVDVAPDADVGAVTPVALQS